MNRSARTGRECMLAKRREPDCDGDPYMTPDDVALQLRMSRKRVYKIIKSGGLRVFRIGRDIRICPKDLQKWLESQREPC
jgi:excisionase family DNA binding protein